MAKDKTPLDVEKFFTDPANAEESEFFRKAVNYLVDERVAKERDKPADEKPGILEQIFGKV